jgi:hypothetical protein
MEPNGYVPNGGAQIGFIGADGGAGGSPIFGGTAGRRLIPLHLVASM